MIDKQKYKNDLKKAGNDAINDLEPILKKGSQSILNIIGDIISDAISAVFENRKNKNINKEIIKNNEQ